MLLASISIIQPALHFLGLAVRGSFLFVVALAAYDVVSRGIHRATVAGKDAHHWAKLAGIVLIAGTDAGRDRAKSGLNRMLSCSVASAAAASVHTAFGVT